MLMQWLFTIEHVLYLFENKIKVNCTLPLKSIHTHKTLHLKEKFNYFKGEDRIPLEEIKSICLAKA